MDLQSIKHQINLDYQIVIKNTHVLDEKDYAKQNTFVSFETLKWLIEQAERAERMEMMYENTGSIMNRRHLMDKVERYEKALNQLAKADASEFLKWQEVQEERGNDLNEWDWFSSLAKFALRTHPNK